MRLTCEQVDPWAEDSDDFKRGPGWPSERFFRHLYFVHFVLGEPWGDSFKFAHRFRDTPLPLHAMHSIAAAWNDEDAAVVGDAPVPEKED